MAQGEQRPVPVGHYEPITDFVGRDMSVRVFRLHGSVDKVELHRHARSTQVYVALEGRIGIIRDGVEVELQPYETLQVVPGVIHGARAVGGDATLMNISTPPLRADDQRPLHEEPHRSDMELPRGQSDLED